MKSKMPIVQGMVSLSFYSREQAKKKQLLKEYRQ